MLDALEEVGGQILRGRCKDAKNGDLASTCASLCNGQGIVEAEIREKAKAWLLEAMRFDGIEEPARTPLRSPLHGLAVHAGIRARDRNRPVADAPASRHLPMCEH